MFIICFCLQQELYPFWNIFFVCPYLKGYQKFAADVILKILVPRCFKKQNKTYISSESSELSFN